jgi:hypothetical protein
MKLTDSLKLVSCYLYACLKHAGQISFIFFMLLNATAFAQEESTALPGSFGIHAGVNTGILSSVAGPSVSLHYAIRTEKVLQVESMLFFDSHSGKTFLSGYNQKNRGLGLVGGIRVNIRPRKNWNPSFVLMPGLMYSSQSTSRYDDRGSSGFSPALSVGLSSTIYKKHMVSLGFNTGENIAAAFLKYGYWF